MTKEELCHVFSSSQTRFLQNWGQTDRKPSIPKQRMLVVYRILKYNSKSSKIETTKQKCHDFTPLYFLMITASGPVHNAKWIVVHQNTMIIGGDTLETKVWVLIVYSMYNWGGKVSFWLCILKVKVILKQKSLIAKYAHKSKIVMSQGVLWS